MWLLRGIIFNGVVFSLNMMSPFLLSWAMYHKDDASELKTESFTVYWHWKNFILRCGVSKFKYGFQLSFFKILKHYCTLHLHSAKISPSSLFSRTFEIICLDLSTLSAHVSGSVSSALTLISDRYLSKHLRAIRSQSYKRGEHYNTAYISTVHSRIAGEVWGWYN